MALKNNEITIIIEELSEKISQGLHAHIQRQGNLSPAQTKQTADQFIEALLQVQLQSEQYYCGITLEQLNENWHGLTGESQLVNTQKQESRYVSQDYTSEEKAQLLSVIQVQLSALARGYQLVQRAQPEERRPEPRTSNARARPPVVVQHVHHYPNYGFYGGYNYNYWLWDDIFCGPSPHYYSAYSSFDWGFIELLRFVNLCMRINLSQTSVPHSSSNDDNNQGGGALAFLAGLALAGFATAAAMYAINEIIDMAQELWHGEALIANSAKAGILSMAAYSGIQMGFMVALSTTLPPAFASFCMAIILTGVSAKLSKEAIKFINRHTNTSSAISDDTRFTLAQNESYGLQGRGFNPLLINEALREVAILFKRNQANRFVFWSDQNKERRGLINLMRALKQGEYENITINGKAFTLKDPLLPPAYAHATVPLQQTHGHAFIPAEARLQYQPATVVPTPSYSSSSDAYSNLWLRPPQPSAPPAEDNPQRPLLYPTAVPLN